MGFYRFIKVKSVGDVSKYIGYSIPRMYRLDFDWRELKLFRFQFVKERMNGWTIWWVENENDYQIAITKLNELNNVLPITYKVAVES